MAQKAAKATAKRNGEILNRTHLIALTVNGLFLLFRALLFRQSFTRRSFFLYVFLSIPAAVIEFLFERNSRPKYNVGASGEQLRSSGEDLDAKGVTEWMWDVLYWSWACVVAAALFGDRAWWFYSAVPCYSLWLGYTTFGSVRKGLGGLAGAASPNEVNVQAESKRQQKLEKRGGQKVQYR